jgi:hypothetical protein
MFSVGATHKHFYFGLMYRTSGLKMKGVGGELVDFQRLFTDIYFVRASLVLRKFSQGRHLNL